MMRLKTKTKTSRSPSTTSTTSTQPGRTLVFTSAVSQEPSTTDYLPALDMTPAHHDFLYGLEDELFRTSTTEAPQKENLCVQQYFQSRQPTPSPSVLRDLHQRNQSTSSSSSAPSTASDESDGADDADDDASDEGFDDLPEESGSPIHALAPMWPWHSDEPARAIRIICVGKPTMIDITLSAMAKTRYAEVTPGARRPEKRWAQSHLRQVSDESSTSASSASSSPSPTSESGHSTPATSAAEESDSCSDTNSTSSHYATPSTTPAFLSTDPFAPPRIPLRSQHRTTWKSASISGPPPPAPTRPAPTISESPDSSFETQRPPMPTRRLMSEQKVKPARFSPRRKSISALLSMSQNVLS